MFKYESPYELEKGTNQSAGWDLKAMDDVYIPPFGNAIIDTGVKLEIKDTYFALVTLRSGHGFKRDLFCHIGIVDPDYRGNIKVKVFNFSNNHQVIKKNEPFAQFTILSTYMENEGRGYIDPNTVRGEGGFGSTTIVS